MSPITVAVVGVGAIGTVVDDFLTRAWSKLALNAALNPITAADGHGIDIPNIRVIHALISAISAHPSTVLESAA